MNSIENKVKELIYGCIKANYIKETNTGKALDKKAVYKKFKSIGIDKRKANELLIEFDIVEVQDGRATKSIHLDGKKKRCIVVSDEFINRNGFVF